MHERVLLPLLKPFSGIWFLSHLLVRVSIPYHSIVSLLNISTPSRKSHSAFRRYNFAAISHYPHYAICLRCHQFNPIYEKEIWMMNNVFSLLLFISFIGMMRHQASRPVSYFPPISLPRNI